MANYAMFTKLGLNEIANASQNGQYMEIGAYVPVYDYRYDPYIGLISAGALSAIQVSAYTSEYDQFPQGEVIWNTTNQNAYSLSPNSNYLKKVDTDPDYTGNSVITQYIHSNKVQINIYNASPMSNHYTAVTDVKNPGVMDNNWNFNPSAIIPSSANNAPANLSAVTFPYLYNGVSYQPVLLSGTERRANFKVTCRCPVGQFKFNKLALYGVKRTSTSAISTNPFLFAQVILPEPYILHSNQSVATSGFSLSEFVLDFQVETKQFTTEFENIFYGTSGDYWKRVTIQSDGSYGVLYDGFVAISNALAIDDQLDLTNTSAISPPSKLFVSTFEKINAENINVEKYLPQLGIQYVDKNSNRSRTTLKVVQNGDCEIDMYGACTSANPIPSMIPRYDGEVGLGTNVGEYKRWNHLNLKHSLEITNSNFLNLNDQLYDTFYMRATTSNENSAGVLEIYNGDIINGPRYSELDIVNIENTLTKKPSYWYYYGNISSPRTHVKGLVYDIEDLLLRSFNNVTMACIKSEYNDLSSQEIIRRIETMDTTSDEGSAILKEDQDILLATKGVIKVSGHIIPFKNSRVDLGRSELPFDRFFTNQIASDASDLLIRGKHDIGIANIKPDSLASNESSNSIMKKLWSMDPDSDSGYDTDVGTPLLGKDKDILIATNRWIKVKGNIIPFKNNDVSIGSPERYLNKLYVKTLYTDNIVIVNGIGSVYVAGSSVVQGNSVNVIDYNSTEIATFPLCSGIIAWKLITTDIENKFNMQIKFFCNLLNKDYTASTQYIDYKSNKWLNYDLKPEISNVLKLKNKVLKNEPHQLESTNEPIKFNIKYFPSNNGESFVVRDGYLTGLVEDSKYLFRLESNLSDTQDEVFSALNYPSIEMTLTIKDINVIDIF